MKRLKAVKKKPSNALSKKRAAEIFLQTLAEVEKCGLHMINERGAQDLFSGPVDMIRGVLAFIESEFLKHKMEQK